ncbi:hypothetical protein A3F52_04835 [Candidatus Uhrbacteria bacterium RIFCSPHIGHO2_12_FULL_47_11]|nr:MAG: hypothetical protein A2753_02765 [Candidatus Uhrbacteria bacterium RIFCSPHIGHO2_01_FULL_47_11]OGL68002.1 MAG: hypothetical protein A3D58_01495 [Candidatus Uhrbacteria bacterium RIFCSPHIGHO2_02_FULL_46_47]OGL75414.1 MAG: hypothetical protein A3F52_04835 [Candidatus Uhrbacteria bacterium RIFCSPHIGHO2_12_FULL_47_11]
MNTSMMLFYSSGVLAVGFAAAGAFFFAYKRHYKPALTVSLVLSVIFSIYTLIAQFLRYYSLHVYIDFAAWPELLNSIIVKGYPASSIQGFLLGQSPLYHWFAAHFTPFLYLFALPFKLAPRPETIMVLNFLVMLSAIIPLYKLAALTQGNKRFARFVVVLFLWYPTFQYITLYGFEMLRLSIPILLWMIYFWESRKSFSYFIFVILAILIREDVGLTVGMFGIYILLLKQVKHARIKGIVTCVLGFGGFLIITKMLMPLFSATPGSNHIVAKLLDHYGNTPFEIVKNMFLQHGVPGSGWLNPIKWANIAMLFLPFIFVPFLAPKPLLGILASVGLGLVSYSITHISYMLYYISPAIPFIFYAFIKAWPRLISLSLWERVGVRAGKHDALMCAVLAGALISNIWFGPSLISLQFWFRDLRPASFRTQDFHWSSYRITDHHKNIATFVNLIPDEAIVSAQEFSFPRFFRKKGIMRFPRLESDNGRIKADYVFLDITNNGLSAESPVVHLIKDEDIRGVMDNPDEWRLIDSDGAYFLYKRIADVL